MGNGTSRLAQASMLSIGWNEIKDVAGMDNARGEAGNRVRQHDMVYSSGAGNPTVSNQMQVANENPDVISPARVVHYFNKM